MDWIERRSLVAVLRWSRMDDRHQRGVESRTRWLQLIVLAASFYNVGAVWLAQMGWSLWRYVGRDEFPRYHRAWFLGMMPTIWPMATVAGAGSLLQMRWRPTGVTAWATWAGAALQIANFGLTGAWWARWQAQLDQARLEDGSLNPLYVRLLRTHWLRVAIITLFALLQAWMAASVQPVPAAGRKRAAQPRFLLKRRRAGPRLALGS